MTIQELQKLVDTCPSYKRELQDRADWTLRLLQSQPADIKRPEQLRLIRGLLIKRQVLGMAVLTELDLIW